MLSDEFFPWLQCPHFEVIIFRNWLHFIQEDLMDLTITNGSKK